MGRGRGKDSAVRHKTEHVTATFQDIKRRKEDEQQKIRKGGRQQDESWHRIVSKKEVRKQKKLWTREEMLRNTTSFYVSNLPEGCTTRSFGLRFNNSTIWKTHLSRTRKMALETGSAS
ncbi:hypothetical protein Hanom_Chr12g01161091 [Helianthus anomalus]